MNKCFRQRHQVSEVRGHHVLQGVAVPILGPLLGVHEETGFYVALRTIGQLHMGVVARARQHFHDLAAIETAERPVTCILSLVQPEL